MGKIKNFKDNKKKNIVKTAFQVLIGATLLLLLVLGVVKFEALDKEQNLELTKQAIQKATVQCYANEGRYPDSVEYLIENYDLFVDYDRFNVLYDSFASNILPNINVFIKE